MEENFLLEDAYHEAGHVAMAYILGFTPYQAFITVSSENDEAGISDISVDDIINLRTSVSRLTKAANNDSHSSPQFEEDRLTIDRKIQVSCAGICAEFRFSHPDDDFIEYCNKEWVHSHNKAHLIFETFGGAGDLSKIYNQELTYYLPDYALQNDHVLNLLQGTWNIIIQNQNWQLVKNIAQALHDAQCVKRLGQEQIAEITRAWSKPTN